MAGNEPELFGRQRELAQITPALDDVRTGHGRLVMLSGEPGIGKTRLADHAMALAATRGLTVLWGRCWEAGGAPAYWPWLDLLSTLVAALDDTKLRLALGEGAALVGELCPELRSRLPDLGSGATPPLDEGRFRLGRAVTALVREVAAKGPGLAIAIDDLHAADTSSLLLLHFLARQLRSLRVLLLGTYRDVEARMDTETSALISDIGREGLTIGLARLDRASAQSLVRARAGVSGLSAMVESTILERTQGNPLFLEEMVRLLDEQGSESVAAGVVPQSVRDVIRQRLDRLTGSTRPVLNLAAVVGDEIDVALLGPALGHDAGWVVAQLGAAVHAGALVERAGRWRFAHALLREVLYRGLDDDERRALHGTVAQAILRLTAPGVLPAYAELAHHALLGPPDMLDLAVDSAIRAAARAQELLGYDEAGRVLTAAADAIAAAGNPPLLRARVLLAMGDAEIRRGQAVLGKAHCREAATIARGLGDADLVAQAALTYGRVFSFGSVDPVLVQMLEESLAALPTQDSAVRARLLARLGAALQPHPRIAEPVRLAREAITTARRLGNPATLLETLHDGISALMDVVDPAEQLALNLEAETLALELGDRERLLRTHGRLAIVHLSLGELAEADARIDSFEALAEALKAPWYAWRGCMLRSVRALMHGRFAEAKRLADQASEQGQAANDPMAERIWISNREAQLRAAERHDEMIAWEPQVRRTRASFNHAQAWQASGSALTYARIEDKEKTRAYIDLLPEYFHPPEDNPFSLFFVAEGAALSGRRDLAASLYDRIRALPNQYIMLGMSYMSWEGPSARLLGLLAAHMGRFDEAWAHFDEALVLCRRLDTKPYLARTEYEYARALLARGSEDDRTRARPLLESARAQAQALGMPGLVRLVNQQLAGGPETAAAITSRAHPVESPAKSSARLPFSFALEGEYWAITHEQETFRLKDSLGLQYLVTLLRDPGHERHVLDLAGERGGGGDTHAAVDTGDAGELLDPEARATYRRRLEDLEETVTEAESFGDQARAARAREEIEFLASELGRAVGLGGRVRRAGGAGERARSAVQRRIKNALNRIGEHAPALAAYLGRTVKTGNFCVFRPDPDS